VNGQFSACTFPFQMAGAPDEATSEQRKGSKIHVLRHSALKAATGYGPEACRGNVPNPCAMLELRM